MFGFLNKNTFACMNEEYIQCYLLYDCKNFKEEFKNYNRVDTIL